MSIQGSKSYIHTYGMAYSQYTKSAESGSFIESTPVRNSFERILSIIAIGSHHLVLKQPLNRRRGPVSRLRNDKTVTFGAPTRCSRRVVLWCVRACVTHLTGCYASQLSVGIIRCSDSRGIDVLVR